MVRIETKDNGVELSARIGESLMSVIQRAGLDFGAPCGGNHSCGKCLVEVCGAVSPPTAEEVTLLTDKTARLACFAKVEGDCTVRLPDATQGKVVTDFISCKSDATNEGLSYGFAVDVGTTTLAVYLYHGQTQIDSRGEYNQQRRFGADVMARIAYANDHGVAPLHEVIWNQLATMFQKLCQAYGVPCDEIVSAVITGNTTMLHLLAGLSVTSLGQYPFLPESLFGEYLEKTCPDFPNLQIYLPHCISAYVGADIVCGMAACDLFHKQGNVLYLDIGTNGEMALKTDAGLLTCSTAAGPAFEGAGIIWGCGAKSGAISKVHPDWTYETLEHSPAVGICGSGLVDAIATAIRLGYIDKKGRILPPFQGEIPFAGCAVVITQGDIRQFQMAKGAIRGGIDTLLHHGKLAYEDLDSIILSGGFGTFINRDAAEIVGLLPPGGAAKTKVIGNSAGQGAAMALIGALTHKTLQNYAEGVAHMELSTDAFFKKRYIRSMYF